MIASLSKGVFREIVADFKNRHPDIDVHFVESERGDLLTRLEHSELDAVFASGEAQPGKDDCLLVVREPIFVAMRSECEFSKASRLGWRQISEEHFVISDQEPGPDIHSYVVRRAGDLGRQIRATRFGVGREGIMTLVGLGFGVSVVADHWRGVSYPNVSFVPVGTVGETVPFSLWWKQENDNPALRRFLSITRIQARRAQSSSAPL